mmetsp:Transcript_25223/g.74028  ORF Transcript_25223/g.74028 Transcript_25223/m.74028 type:complete len:341 (-) Transcript_25223:322-1344(-)
MGGGQSKGKKDKNEVKTGAASSSQGKNGVHAPSPSAADTGAAGASNTDWTSMPASGKPSVVTEANHSTEESAVEAMDDVTKSPPPVSRKAPPPEDEAKEPPKALPKEAPAPSPVPAAARKEPSVKSSADVREEELSDGDLMSPHSTRAPKAGPTTRHLKSEVEADAVSRATETMVRHRGPDEPEPVARPGAHDGPSNRAPPNMPSPEDPPAKAKEPETAVAREWAAISKDIERLDADLFPTPVHAAGDSGLGLLEDSLPQTPETPPKHHAPFQREHELLDDGPPPPSSTKGKWTNNDAGSVTKSPATTVKAVDESTAMYKSVLDDEDMMLIHDIEDEFAM